MRKLSLIVLLFLTLLGTASLNTPTAQAAAGVNNFTIQDYQIDYYLGRDGDGRSTLKTVESITALFPEDDQNHGLERAIPASYDGHSTHLKIDAVVDGYNQNRAYTTYDSGGNTVVRIGDPDSYAHGLQTYKLTYTQHDVTKYFSNTGRDEFYWDTNGVDWRVFTLSLTTRLHLSDSLRAATTGDMACYSGPRDATTTCPLTLQNNVYTTTTTALPAAHGVTIAVGFKAKTFSPYAASTAEKLLGVVIILSLISIPIASILLIWFTARYYRRSNRSAEINTIVTEFLPPKDTSVSTAAAVSNKPQRSFSAQLIDFAVRHYIKIYETRAKTFWHSAKYELEITKDIGDLKAEEQELLRDIFDSTTVGTKLDMSTMKKNYALAAKLQDNPEKLRKSITGGYGLRARDDKQSRWFKRAGFITLIAAVLLFSPALLIAAIFAFCYGAVLKPLTDKGLALARYLKGLEMYIKVAETERLRMLQSPEGAEKVAEISGSAVDAKNPKQLIKLYERVLPYAILFGQEKEWNKRLGDYYQTANQSPDWYSGHSAVFNAAVFSSAISNFNSAATYSNPTSSSSGGSGGGGSSGGGGGGGGGGGW